MTTLEQQLARRADAAATSPMPYERTPQDVVLTKAFRLKHFGRCPACDVSGVDMRERLDYRGWELRCPCSWRASVTALDVVNADDAWICVVDLGKCSTIT